MASNLRVDSIIPSTGANVSIGTATGGVNIPGVLTYEDVTNVDSIGIITARTGIKIGPSIGVAATIFADGSINTSGIVTAINISAASSVTATTFYGDGGQLTGISVDSTKIETGNTKVETIDTGSDGHVKITTEGTERLRIDANGYVTKPAHPCFDVVKSDSHQTGTGYIVYNKVNINNGNHYSTTTGKFTAPVAGFYFFSYGLIKNALNSVTRVYIYKNGATLPTGSQRHLRMDSGQSYGDNGAMTIVTELAVGDEIQIYMGQGQVYGTSEEYTYFNGFLIG